VVSHGFAKLATKSTTVCTDQCRYTYFHDRHLSLKLRFLKMGVKAAYRDTDIYSW